MNIDWENITAKDLYVLLNSFISGKEKIFKVEIYPSEFGINELEKLKNQGPDIELFEEVDEKNAKLSKKENNTKDDNNSQNQLQKEENLEYINDLEDAMNDNEFQDHGINQSKLRKFELKKLKYFYAIATFDSKESAGKIYNLCDGMEIEKTQSFLDLRFVPDSLIDFPYPPKEVFNGSKSLINYEPEFNENRALQHSKVRLTWDTNDRKRDNLIKRAFTKEGFNRDDINDLLVSSDSEEDDDLTGLKELLNSAKEENEMSLLKRKKNKEFTVKEGETFEVNFNKGFEGFDLDKNISNSTHKDRSLYKEYLDKKKNIRREKKTEERVERENKKKRRNGEIISEENNINEKKEYNENRQNKKIEKSNKQELSLLVDDSLKDKKFRYNSNDDRFNAVGKDSKYAVDPTSKEYKNIKSKKR